jgi:hypothetical protein
MNPHLYKKRKGGPATMKKVLAFALHVFVAMAVSTVLGGLLLILLNNKLGKLKNPWFDVPYSPVFWGSAFLLGLLLSRVIRSPSAKWVWLVGVFWLALVAVGNVNAYDPHLPRQSDHSGKFQAGFRHDCRRGKLAA